MAMPDYFFQSAVGNHHGWLLVRAAHCAGHARWAEYAHAIPPCGLLFLRLSEQTNALETASRREAL
jgi:hypothetical protein